MESVKDNPITKTKNGEVITFIPKGEIEKARRELSVSGFDEGKFSDGELILAIRQKQSVGATTVIPVVLDWLIEKNFILSGSQAISYLHDKGKTANEQLRYQVVGEIDFDADGNYFLVVASSQKKKIESMFKVYTGGLIKELWATN